MSRAFVNEDATHEPEPRYTLPPRESPRFAAAAARALLEGAHIGDERMVRLGRCYLHKAHHR